MLPIDGKPLGLTIRPAPPIVRDLPPSPKTYGVQVSFQAAPDAAPTARGVRVRVEGNRKALVCCIRWLLSHESGCMRLGPDRCQPRQRPDCGAATVGMSSGFRIRQDGRTFGAIMHPLKIGRIRDVRPQSLARHQLYARWYRRRISN